MDVCGRVLCASNLLGWANPQQSPQPAPGRSLTDSGLRNCLLIFEPSKGRNPFVPGLVGSGLGAPCAGSAVVVTGPSLVYSRIFDEVMGCFCDSPPQSPTFPEAGHASLYDEDKVGWVFFPERLEAGLRLDVPPQLECWEQELGALCIYGCDLLACSTAGDSA